MTAKKTSLLLFLFLAGLVFAGDVASFQNLGFSADGRYFMFSQYGIDGNTRNPYAEIYTVDVHRNRFVSGGVWRKEYPVGTTIGDTGQKALFALYPTALNLRNRLKIDVLDLGRPVYFRVVGENDNTKANNVEVLDYTTGKTYKGNIRETVTGQGASARSSFVIDLEILAKSGDVQGRYTVGTPSVSRRGVLDYTIVQIIIAPGNQGLVIVVEREEDDGRGGVNIRYMVETLSL
jgi:predicted secreted protein